MVDGTKLKSLIEQAEQRIDRDGPAALPITLESVIPTNDPDLPFEPEDNSSETRHPSRSTTKKLPPSTVPGENNAQLPEASAVEVDQSKTATSPRRFSPPQTIGNRENSINEAEERDRADGNEPHNSTPDSPIITTEYSRTEAMQYENPAGNRAQFVAEHDPEHHDTCRQRCIRTWELVKRPGPREMREAWEVETIWATWLL